MQKDNAWDSYSAKDIKKLEALSYNYRAFLDKGKTERECVKQIIKAAENAGYKDLTTLIKAGAKLNAGDKVYAAWMNKTVALFHMGSQLLADGMAILGAHIDSPRLDIKQKALYEDTGHAYLDTHYYGGIKKYQWVTLPLAIHGVIAKKDGSIIDISIGDNEDEPVFCITDLLVHLSAEQQKKTAAKLIAGEDLDLLIGSKPLKNTEKDPVAANILNILNKEFGIDEEDFLSAELEVIPAGKSKDAGLDRSMVMGYGHDDRACAYTSLIAMLNSQTPKRTNCCILVDKEEIGSVGATGAKSVFFENTLAEVIALSNQEDHLALRRCLANSQMLSSDVSAAYDPLYKKVYDKRNSAYFGLGLVFNKYTGSHGKSGSNDSNAEYFAQIRKIMDDNKVHFQTAELGKVDAGGGGTIASIMALYGMDVVDCGVAVLNMHSPWELISKADLYETLKGYSAFLKNA